MVTARTVCEEHMLYIVKDISTKKFLLVDRFLKFFLHPDNELCEKCKKNLVNYTDFDKLAL